MTLQKEGTMKSLIMAGVTGLWGLAVMLAVDPANPAPAPLAAAFGGAVMAGLVCARLFLRGRALWSVLAALLASTLGAAFGGFGLVLADGGINPFWAALIGVAFVASALWQVPLALAIWLAGAGTVDRLARRLGRISP